MFNVIINSEQYDEFMAQKEKIKELEARIRETDELQARHMGQIRSKDVPIDFLKSKVDWLDSRLALKETKDITEVKPGLMYLMTAKDASKLCDSLNSIEERLNVLENYIFGGKNNGVK